MLADLCPCFHRSPTKLCPVLVSFTCWIVTEFWSFTRKRVPDLVIRALNCARFCVVCALNCARILVVRALDCAQFLLHVLPFSHPAGTLYIIIHVSMQSPMPIRRPPGVRFDFRSVRWRTITCSCTTVSRSALCLPPDTITTCWNSSPA